MKISSNLEIMNKVTIDIKELKKLSIAILFLFLIITFVTSLFYIRNQNSIDEELNNNIPTLNYLCFYEAEEAKQIINQHSNLEVLITRVSLSDYFLSTIQFNYDRIASLDLKSSIKEILRLTKYNFQCIGKISGSNISQGESYKNLNSRNINKIEIVEIYVGSSPVILFSLGIILLVVLRKIIIRKT